MTTAAELVGEMTRRGWSAELTNTLDRAHRHPVCLVLADDEDRDVDADGEGIEVYEFGDDPGGGFEPGFRWSVEGRVHAAPSSIGLHDLADQFIESIRSG